ncbi:MAG: alpha/beta hydrolase [Fimbriimonas sp.]|nr:alpha/beta hydrolase [Fimbriimonas sp.]
MKRNIIQNVQYASADNPVLLDIGLPNFHRRNGRSPGVVVIHGGGWIAGNRRDSVPVEVSFALMDAGYVVANIDYKLGDNSWPQNLFDCKNAVRYFRLHAQEFGIDPDRIGVVGASAGGHLAMMTALTTGIGVTFRII